MMNGKGKGILGVVLGAIAFGMLQCAWAQPAGQTNYTWTGAGDGTTWSQAANWAGGVVPFNNGTTFQIAMGTGNPTTSLLPINISLADAVQFNDNMFGPEWGQTLNIYGSVTSGLFFAPVGASGGPASVINLYGSGSITVADTFFIGDPFWVNNITIPNVSVNLYDNSQLTANYIGMGGHLSIYGGTVTANIGFLTGSPTWGPWGSSETATGPATTDATRLINIAGGKLVLPGDATDQINDLISRGILQGNGIVGNVNIDTVSMLGSTVITAVPEPSIAVLIAAGVIGVCTLRRRS